MSHDLQCECPPMNRDEVLTDYDMPRSLFLSVV